MPIESSSTPAIDDKAVKISGSDLVPELHRLSQNVRANFNAFTSSRSAGVIHSAISEIERLRKALERVSTPEAFHVATANVDPEAFARMVFAELILKGETCELAAEKAEAETRERYERSRLVADPNAKPGRVKSSAEANGTAYPDDVFRQIMDALVHEALKLDPTSRKAHEFLQKAGPEAAGKARDALKRKVEFLDQYAEETSE